MIYVFAILLPPLALLWRGRAGAALVNVLLCCLLLLPGVVHACVVIGRMDADAREERLLRRLGSGTPGPGPRGGLAGALAVGLVSAGLGVAAGMVWAAWRAGLIFGSAG